MCQPSVRICCLAMAWAVVFSGCQSIQNQPHRDDGLGGLLGLQRRGESEFQDDLISNVDPLGRRGFNRLLLDDLSPGNLSTTLKVRTTYKEDRPAAEAAYKLGQEFYQQGTEALQSNSQNDAPVTLFTDAANQFRLASGKFPDSQLEHDALYFEGESYFFSNQYVRANRAFENLIGRYSGSKYLDKVEARRFAIAEYWQQLSESGAMFKFNDPRRPVKGLATEAQRIFHRIRLDDPTGRLADDATLALANAFFKGEKWLEAADTYEDLRRNYPGSEHQFNARLLELNARLNSYQGKSYDDDPLIKADKILKQLVQQFPHQVQDEKEHLAQQAGLIRHLMAERDWSMGEYFENIGENFAAKYYYQQVAEKYGDTQFADQAATEIERVAALPDKPKKHAQWIVDMFPSTEKAKPIISSNPATTLR